MLDQTVRCGKSSIIIGVLRSDRAIDLLTITKTVESFKKSDSELSLFINSKFDTIHDSKRLKKEK